MKTINLRIGKRGGPYVRIPFSAPETSAEFLQQNGNNDAFLTRCARRGLQIAIQEEGRDVVVEGFKAGKSETEVAAMVVEHLKTVDLTAKKERKQGVPRKPKEIKIDASKKSYTLDEMRALLAANNIAVNDGSAPAAASAPAPTAPKGK